MLGDAGLFGLGFRAYGLRVFGLGFRAYNLGFLGIFSGFRTEKFKICELFPPRQLQQTQLVKLRGTSCLGRLRGFATSRASHVLARVSAPCTAEALHVGCAVNCLPGMAHTH